MSGDDRITTISELRHGLKNVNCIFIVIEAGTKQQTKDGSLVRKCRIADRTGSVVFSIWNEEALAIQTGDIIKLTKGYSSVWKGGLVLYCGKYGTVERLGEFTMVFSETPDMSLRTETTSPRSNSPPPNQSRQPHHSAPSGESSNDFSNNFSEGRGHPGPAMSGRHHDSYNSHSNSHSNPQQSTEFSDGRHNHGKGGGNGFHPSSQHSTPPTFQEVGPANGRFYSNGHDNVKHNVSRRMHHMQSHDNHMTSSNNRHHPYQRHSANNGWR